ncbi:MAG TPA: glucoamylase family protein, partial [Phycisphaerales bacterium]|nr:glucoamylase family protein [Phycisphaerales bacterium]
IGDELVAAADWTAFFEPEPRAPWAEGFISLGWRPDDPRDPAGPGEVLPFGWVDAGCEHRLVTFLGVCADEGKGPAPSQYYRLRRTLGTYDDLGPIVWFPWSGALFTAFFSHCWIDYAHMGPDDPAAHGVERRARVDWWENSRRLATMHRLKAIENPRGFRTVGPNAWGVGASDGPDGYHVAHLHPEPIPMPGAVPGEDYPPERSQDDWLDGTIAPYAAGSCIMFTPQASLAALRHYRSLRYDDGRPLVWREPDPGRRRYGFLDAYNVDRAWVATDYVAIDQGPLLLAIENARTGLVWRLFHAHPRIQSGMERLGLARDLGGGPVKSEAGS